MKPSFTVVRDRSAKCFLLFIRGAISVKDRLTAATGAEVPFHHVVTQDGHVSKLVLGHAHCGMVVAARWIANQAIPCLNEAVAQFPDYGVKVIYFPDLYRCNFKLIAIRAYPLVVKLDYSFMMQFIEHFSSYSHLERDMPPKPNHSLAVIF